MDNRRAFMYFLIGFALGVLIFAAPAKAQTEVPSKWVCAKTESLREDLARNGEQFWASGAVQGADEPKFLMSLWVNPTSGTWTILATLLKNTDVSCIMSFGLGFKEQPRNYI